MTKLSKLVIVFSLLLGACATSGPISMQILQKDNSKIYYAVWTGRTYSNAGFIEMDLGGKTYRGQPGRVNEANLFGLKSKAGTFTRSSSTSSVLTTYYRALLANDEGIGMRCDFYLDLSSGSGLCIDENGKQYEITLLF
jgi:hypothetical protein